LRRLPATAAAYIWAVTALAALAGALLVVFARSRLVGGAAAWIFVALIVVGEFRPVQVPLGNQRLAITTSTTFAFALLLLSGPLYGALGYAAAAALSDLVMRREWWKAMFNAAQYLVSAAAAGLVFVAISRRHLGDPTPTFTHQRELAAAAAAAIVLFLLNAVVTGIALGLAQRLSVITVFREDFGYQAAANLSLLALGPIAVVAVGRNLLLLPVFVIPLATAYRAATLSAEKEHQALHDGLTGLPNRTLFRDLTDRAVAAARHDGSQLAVLLIDLDRFKEVNDTLGHQVGDLVLQHLGSRLQDTVGDDALVARLGGDEFGVLLTGVTEPEEVAVHAERILRALRAAVVLDDFDLEVNASIGIARFPEHAQDADTLIQRADVAMYVAKTGARGSTEYEPALDTNSPLRLALVGELRRAIEHGQLTVWYQPKVRLDTGEAHAVEALVRWDHPTRGALQPNEFIPVAEQTGLVRQLTELVLHKALSQVVEWRAQGFDLAVAVNVSARVLHDCDLPAIVAARLAEHGVEPHRLLIEMTESMIMSDPERSIQALRELRALGVELSVDDYGTGHASLSYLKRLPINEIKIDKSFITNMATEPNDLLITSSTIDLGRRLGLRVVAEGVESYDTSMQLRDLGCDLAQGYFFSPPRSAADLHPWLVQHARRQPVAPAH